MTINEQVYYSLTGELTAEYPLDWVENLCIPGQPCYEAYKETLEASRRLCQRLGVQNEDPDVECIINALLLREKLLSVKMFSYGRKYQKMLDALAE